jgi:(5-formylfuran-3-yl)methyl phosphate synthase
VVTLSFSQLSRPQLLVSVRSLREAQEALAGGCDWLDVKEPLHGPLGAATPEVLQEIEAIAGSFSGWSAALGELSDVTDNQWDRTALQFPSLHLVKLGLADCLTAPAWQTKLELLSQTLQNTRFAMVYYADQQLANSPLWQTVVETAVVIRAPVVLIDTFRKDGETLTDYLPLNVLSQYRRELAALGIGLALAGSLKLHDLPALVDQVRPDIVAVRGAACLEGRNSEVCRSRVEQLKRIVLNSKS